MVAQDGPIDPGVLGDECHALTQITSWYMYITATRVHKCG